MRPRKGGISTIPAVRLWWVNTGILHRENVWIWNTNFNISPGANPDVGFPKPLIMKSPSTRRVSFQVPKRP